MERVHILHTSKMWQIALPLVQEKDLLVARVTSVQAFSIQQASYTPLDSVDSVEEVQERESGIDE